MMYACGHDERGERNLAYENLLPNQRMPTSNSQCPKCVELRNSYSSTDWYHKNKIKFEESKPVQIIPPDPEILKIARLFLEKYEVLSDKDRSAYGEYIRCLMSPPLVFNVEEK